MNRPRRLLSILLLALAIAEPAAASLAHAFTSGTDVPVTASAYTADGTLDLTLDFTPAPGTNLTVVKNTGTAFIAGTFANAPQGGTVPLTHNGITYQYIANYYGGNGRSLVLQWPCTGLAGWGSNQYSQVGNNSSNGNSLIAPTATVTSGVLAGKTVISVAAGGAHSLALTSDGKIFSWGANLSGQLGNNTLNSKQVPVEVEMSGALLGKTVVAVAAGTDHSLALTSDGLIFAWGSNANGQLGNNSSANSPVPVPVSTDGVLAGKTVVAVTAGVWHNLALTSEGKVVTWGYNALYQLGTSDMPDSKVPVLAAPAEMAGKTIVALAAGFYHSMALTSDNKILAWGSNSDGQLGKTGVLSGPTPVEVSTSGVLSGKQVASIAAGSSHSMAVTTDGHVYAWGNNWYGQLGDNSTTSSLEPIAVSTSGSLAGKVLIASAGGSQHSLALAADGKLFSWGDNGFAQLGINSTMSGPFLVPDAVDTSGILRGRVVTKVAASVQFNMALFGLGSPTVTRHPANQMAAAGSSATFSASANDPFPFSARWQVSETGTSGPFTDITGNATATTNNLVLSDLTPAQNGSAYRVVFTNAAGITETTAASLAVVSWSATLASATGIPFESDGVSVSGSLDLQLGFAPAAGTHLTIIHNTGAAFIQGAFDNLPQGGRITLIHNGVNYDFIANYYGGNGRSLVLQWPWMKLSAWGQYSSGQLINGISSNSTLPALVNANGALAGKVVFSTTAGFYFNMAVTSEGKLLAWGNNGSGQLGNNSNTRSETPVAVDTSGVLAGKTIVAVAGGDNHALALSSDGMVFSWGDNGSGRMGNGAYVGSKVPVAVQASGILAGKTITAIAAGTSHSLALDAEGRVFSWGSNGSGQLGNTIWPNSNVPVAVDAGGALLGKTVIAIAAGENHSLALTSDGKVIAWGANGSGQLGNNSTIESNVPVMVHSTGALAGKTVVAISAGIQHSMALTSDGRVFTWGYNWYGQLGDNSTTDSAVPLAVNTSGVLAGKSVASITAGSHHCLALTADGEAVSWGYNSPGQLGNGTSTNSPIPVAVGGLLAGRNVTSISAGYGHSLAMHGVTGGPTATANPVSQTVILGTSPSGVALGFSAAAVDVFPFSIQWQVSPTGIAGPFSDITGNPSATTGTLSIPDATLTENGYAYRAAFSNTGGTSNSTPATLTVLSASNPLNFTSATDILLSAANPSVSGTLNFTLGFAPVPGTDLTVIRNTGPGFISGAFANLPQGSTYPLTFGGVTHSYIVNYYGGANGRSLVLQWPLTRVTSWGAASLGQLGNNSSTSSKIPVAVNTSGALSGKNVMKIAAGSHHGLALTSEGRICAWGGNSLGQLGNHSTTNSLIPVAVDDSDVLQGKTMIAIAAGDAHSLALSSEGKVFAWGANGSGRLGNNSTINSAIPVAVGTTGAMAGKTVVAIAAGFTHSLALTSDGRIFAWGSNTTGQLGTYSSANSSVPVEVAQDGVLADKTVVSIAAGNSFSLALTSDGRVYSWGSNISAQLGINGPPSSFGVPVAAGSNGLIAGKTTTAIAAGASHCLALTSDSKVYAWGLGTSGQLGNGGSSTTPFPQSVNTSGVLSGKSVIAIAAGSAHSMAVTSDGKAYSWGSNNSGQLGDNSFNSTSTTPVAVTTASGAVGGRSVVAIAGGSTHSLALCGAGRAPVAEISPANQTIPASGTVTFTALADGYPAPTVRWQQSSTGAGGTFSNITGNASATTGTLELTNVPASRNGYAYRAVFTNIESSVNGTPATLSVIPPPQIITPPDITVGATGKNGTVVSFVVTANDNLDGPLVPLCTPPSGSLFPIGTTTVNCTVTNSLGSTTTASFTVTVKRTYAAFVDLYGLTDTDPSSDPNHSGMSNLIVYAFGMDPAAPDRSELPAVTMVGGRLRISYPRWKDAADLAYIVEVSDDLNTWNSGSAHTELLSITPINTTRERVVEQDLAQTPGATRRFIRVRLAH